MPAYAGFADLADYLTQRCQRDGVNHSQLSQAIGAQPNYIHLIIQGKFSPSRPRADKIAKHFGDEPHLVRVLAGLESPPPAADKNIREIADLAAALDKPGRLKAIDYLKYLLSQQKRR